MRFLTAGESHGKALVGIIEGFPAGMGLTAEFIQIQMKRRKMGFGRGARQKIEGDLVEIVSGVRGGETLGSPISLIIQNNDWSAWKEIMRIEPHVGSAHSKRQVKVPRPGHADLVGGLKYDHADMRNVLERASARETAMRVALGSVARKFLEDLGISVASRVVRIGGIFDENPLNVSIEDLNARADASPVRCTQLKVETRMVQEIEQAKKDGNTVGGCFEVYASHLPVGLGSYSQWDRRLEGQIAEAFLSLNAVKGIEVGIGFQSAGLPGSQVHDELFPGKIGTPGRVTYHSNHSGGIEGGMSTGQPVVVRAAMKPLATLMKPLRSVNLDTGEATSAHVERSDICAVPSAAVIGESLLSLVLAETILEKFGGDSMKEIMPRIERWRQETEAFRGDLDG